MTIPFEDKLPCIEINIHGYKRACLTKTSCVF